MDLDARDLSRRRFLEGLALAGGVAVVADACTKIGSVSGSDFGQKITLDQSADEIKKTITQTRRPVYHAAGRFYLIGYDANDPRMPRYEQQGVAREGLMAIYHRCTHLGCRVPFCETSRWFECPCHTGYYDNLGELVRGSATRGLDRFRIQVEKGVVTVDTSEVIPGPAFDPGIKSKPSGPLCVKSATAF